MIVTTLPSLAFRRIILLRKRTCNCISFLVKQWQWPMPVPLAWASTTHVRWNPCELGANHTTTSAGGKRWECCRYGHLLRYRAVHHTVAGWVWPTQPTTQHYWVWWANSSSYGDTGRSGGCGHWSFWGSTSSITGVPHRWGWPHPHQQWPYYANPS